MGRGGAGPHGGMSSMSKPLLLVHDLAHRWFSFVWDHEPFLTRAEVSSFSRVIVTTDTPYYPCMRMHGSLTGGV